MVLGRLFGGTTVDTNYSLRELINRLHTSTEHINRAMKDHASNSNPIVRATTLGRILFQIFRFQILEKKLVAAYLKLVAGNINNVSAHFSSNPQQQGAIESTFEQIENNLKGVMKEESRERGRSHYLRMVARGLMNKSKSSKRSVKANIGRLQRQSVKRQAQQQTQQAKVVRLRQPKQPEQQRRAA